MNPNPDTSERNTITEVTRRAILDYLSVGRHWSGALQDDEFLGRIYDLKRMPSTDYRYKTAGEDIWKHRVMNNDWSDDWVFTDGRFDLLFGADEPFLKFLAETVHPIVRPDTQDALQMVAEYNSALNVDGWEIYQTKAISGKPVFGYRQLLGTPHQLEEAKRVAERLTGPYIAQQVRRLQEAADADAELAIGTAKEFLETICKTILAERGTPAGKNDDLPGIVRAAIRSVEVVPPELAGQPQLEKSVTVLLNNLGSIGHQLAELRNQYGTGHGRSTDHIGLPVRHAKLAIGAAAALAVFLYECHEAKPPI
jgi:hypothetical protein